MKARLLAPLVDLLLGCFLVMVGCDDSPGIEVSTMSELAAALLREGELSSATIDGIEMTMINRAGVHGGSNPSIRSMQSFVR